MWNARWNRLSERQHKLASADAKTSARRSRRTSTASPEATPSARLLLAARSGTTTGLTRCQCRRENGRLSEPAGDRPARRQSCASPRRTACWRRPAAAGARHLVFVRCGNATSRCRLARNARGCGSLAAMPPTAPSRPKQQARFRLRNVGFVWSKTTCPVSERAVLGARCPYTLAARSDRLPRRVGGCHGREELLETGCEYVVIVAGDHVPGGTDVHPDRMGDQALHIGHAGVADDVGVPAAHD